MIFKGILYDPLQNADNYHIVYVILMYYVLGIMIKNALHLITNSCLIKLLVRTPCLVIQGLLQQNSQYVRNFTSL